MLSRVKRRSRILVALLLLALVPMTYAQWRRSRSRGWSMEQYREQIDFPSWTVKEGFEQDTFTFVRVQYDSGRGGWGRRGGGWRTDWPDSDLNFSLRHDHDPGILI